MPKKEDLFSKLNIKDYNNYLEEVLETKNFSSDAKNFLLSILYKIETAYNDYYTVKSIDKTKKEFIEEIIEIIKNNCDKLELIKPSNKKYSEFENKKEKCIVNKEKKEIISLYNEQVLLYAIFKLKDNEGNFKNDILKAPLQELFDNGKNINAKEVIRDFDGWAWNIEINQIESIEYNLVFQNILMLIGDEQKTEEQIKKSLNKIYEKEEAKNFYILLCNIALKLYLSNHRKGRSYFEKIQQENAKELVKMKNKDQYLEDININRKKVEKRLKFIDECLSNPIFLKNAYIKTNEKLQEDKKIFSISDFEENIQEEKAYLICELQKYNNKMLPKAYIKEKEELKEKLKILEVLNNTKNVYKYILELQKGFIKGIQEKIKKVQTRTEVMSIIYKFRYYKFLPYKDKQIKDVEELQDDISRTEKMLYNVACKMNVINQISVNEKVNYEVIKNILDTNIIELENIELLFTAENYQITLKVFDEENIEKVSHYNTIEGLVARMNKKIRLFIK